MFLRHKVVWLKKLKISVGDKVSEGSTLVFCYLETSGGAAPAAAESAARQPPHLKPAPAQQHLLRAPAPAAAEKQVIDVEVPDIGGDTDVDVIDVLVAVGDEIEAEAGLITLGNRQGHHGCTFT